MRAWGGNLRWLLLICAAGCALPDSHQSDERSPLAARGIRSSSGNRGENTRRPTSLADWFTGRFASHAAIDENDGTGDGPGHSTHPISAATPRSPADFTGRYQPLLPQTGGDPYSRAAADAMNQRRPWGDSGKPALTRTFPVTQISAVADPGLTSNDGFVPSAPPPVVPQTGAPESAPGRPQELFVPLNPSLEQGIVEVDAAGERVSLKVPGAPLAVVLNMIAEQHGLNLVAGDEVLGVISVNLHDVPLEDALDSILTVNGYTWHLQRGILLVSRISTESNLSSLARGLTLRVFPLNYVSAEDIDQVVSGLLSPVGHSVVTVSDHLDSRRTREEIVVEDLPQYVARVEDYIRQVDVPPRQVLIEVHILEVDLEDNTRHGVNWEALLRLSDTRVTLETTGFADDMASPAFFFGIDATDLDVLLEMLKTTTDAKTLASPKVLALNAQNARIQIGEQLGYFVTTVTQTSTLQDVNFLNVGVVLDVTPIITNDGHILMEVLPKVSGGRINPDTGLPEEDTTEVETTVMLRDGQGIVIGGLIQEEDSDIQSKIPIVGDYWKMGRLFQRRTAMRNRSEVIIALIPRIIYDPAVVDAREHEQYQRAVTPLVQGPLEPVDRRVWEAQLPDAMNNPRRLDRHRLREWPRNVHDPLPLPTRYYFPTEPERFRPPFPPSPVIEGMPPAAGPLIIPQSSTAEHSATGGPVDESTTPDVAPTSPLESP